MSCIKEAFYHGFKGFEGFFSGIVNPLKSFKSLTIIYVIP